MRISHSTSITSLSNNPNNELTMRPPKKMKSSDTLDAVLFLTNVGICNFRAKNYDIAEILFKQALCKVDVQCIHSDVKSAAASKITTKNIIPNTTDKNQQECNKTVQNSNDSNTMYETFRHELNEGMLVYSKTLRVNESDPQDAIASTLSYNIAQTYIYRHQYDEAILWLRRSLSILKTLAKTHSMEGVKILHNIGYCCYCLGNDADSLQCYRHALSLVLEMDLHRSEHIAASLNCIAILHFHNNSPTCKKNALNIFLKSISIYKSIIGENSITTATVLNNAAGAYYSQKKYEDAKQVCEQALQIRQELLGLESIDFLASLYNLCLIYQQLGDKKRFMECSTKFRHIAQSLNGSKSWFISLMYRGIGEAHYEQSEFQSAYFCCLKALDIQRSIAGTVHSEISFTLNRLGAICVAMQDYNTALLCFQERLKVEEKVYPPNDQFIISCLKNIATVNKLLEKYDEALTIFKRVRELQILKLGPNDISVADTCTNMGVVNYHSTKFIDAVLCFQDAIEIQCEYYGNDNHDDIAFTLNYLGMAWFKQGFLKIAEGCITKSLQVQRDLHGSDYSGLALLWHNLGTISFDAGYHDTAIEYYKESVRIERVSVGPNHPDYSLSLHHLILMYQAIGDFEESLKYALEALTIEKEKNQSNQRKDDLCKILTLIGTIYLQQGKTKEMMKFLSEAVRLQNQSSFSSDMMTFNRPEKQPGYDFYGLSKIHPPCAATA